MAVENYAPNRGADGGMKVGDFREDGEAPKSRPRLLTMMAHLTVLDRMSLCACICEPGKLGKTERESERQYRVSLVSPINMHCIIVIPFLINIFLIMHKL